MKLMMLVLLFFYSLLFSGLACNAQESVSKFNLDFEENFNKNELPDGWIRWGTADYSIQTDTSIKYSGKYSVLISSTPNSTASSFSSAAHQLPANYKASSITLTGYMKTEEVKEGFAGLLLRVDGKSKQLAFDNMQNRNINGTNDWSQYKITLPFSTEAKRIFVAGLLNGKGRAWFDKFEVFLDEKDISEVPQITEAPAKAAFDKEFDSGSNIQLNNLTELQIANLFKVGKVWGFLKYYHPDIAKGNSNWDYELIRILTEVIDNNNNVDINSILKNHIDRLGEITSGNDTYETKEIKLTPDLNWINDINFLGLELSMALKNVRKSKKPDEHYYVGLMEGIGNPIFQNENPYPNMRFDDDGFKLLGLFRYWNIIQYYFPYRNLIDEQWNEILKSFIPRIVSADNELSYKLTLLELIGKVNDTHANIWQKDETLERFWGVKAAPIEVSCLDNQVVVSKIYAQAEDNSGISFGDMVTKVNNIPIEKLIAEKIKYCPASNLSTKHRDVARKLLRTNDDSLLLTIRREETTFNKKIGCIDYGQINYWKNDTPSFKILEGNIGYIFPGSLKKGEIDNIMATLANTNGLIIDMRCYPSDFIVFSLGKYLMPQPTEFVKFTTGSLSNPGEFKFSQSLNVGEKRDGHYKNKVVIIINEITQSQAEYTTMALRVAPNSKILGSTTAGADGNVSTIILPGNIRTMISGIGVYYPDGRETQRIGIVPDIKIKPSIKGIKNGDDELLSKAIEIINQE